MLLEMSVLRWTESVARKAQTALCAIGQCVFFLSCASNSPESHHFSWARITYKIWKKFYLSTTRCWSARMILILCVCWKRTACCRSIDPRNFANYPSPTSVCCPIRETVKRKSEWNLVEIFYLAMTGRSQWIANWITLKGKVCSASCRSSTISIHLQHRINRVSFFESTFSCRKWTSNGSLWSFSYFFRVNIFERLRWRGWLGVCWLILWFPLHPFVSQCFLRG